MSQSRILLLAPLMLAPAAAAEARIVGADAAACAGGKPSLLVRVSGFKKPTGTVKVALYSADNYLVKGGKLRKVVVPVQSGEPIDVCIAAPRAGNYAVAVHHDVNGNGKDASDGAGFSGNPRLSITNLKPSFSRIAVQVGGAPRPVAVVLQYRSGLSIRPTNS